MPVQRTPSRAILVSVRRALAAPPPAYYLLLGLTLFIVAFGIVMVLSSSSVTAQSGSRDAYSRFWPQAAVALVGVATMLIVSRLPRRFWERTIRIILVMSCLLQVIALTTPLGIKVGDNTNWLRIGGFSIQPSEAIKVSLVVWLGIVLARKRHSLTEWRSAFFPVVPVAGGAILLVILGGDLGTTVILAGVVFGAMFFAGARIKHLLVAIGAAAVLAILVALSSATRRGRIFAFFGGESAVNPDVHWQVTQGNYALASGGIFGRGLGNSRSKWFWLPSADTDFIMAIIGEELGLIGTLLVLMLFVLLAAALFRIMSATTDPASRITTAAIMVWIIGQAFVNIAVVLGLIPVLGVPLPLISAGGTALLSTLAALGIVLSFARVRPPPPAASRPPGPPERIEARTAIE